VIALFTKCGRGWLLGRPWPACWRPSCGPEATGRAETSGPTTLRAAGGAPSMAKLVYDILVWVSLTSTIVFIVLFLIPVYG
jgi:hypothetical protein